MNQIWPLYIGDMGPNSPSYQPGSGKAAGETISSNAEMFVSRKEVFSMDKIIVNGYTRCGA